MTSSAPRPSRRIASNLLWAPQGLVRHPLLTLGADGRVLSAESCPDPDRLAATEFYAGLLVPDFPADYRAAFDGMRVAALPLSELLPRIVTPGGALVVISGLDYDSLRLTPQSQIRSASRRVPRPNWCWSPPIFPAAPRTPPLPCWKTIADRTAP